MTTPTTSLPVVAANEDLTSELRKACLQWLAGEWNEDHPLPEHWQMLSGWVDPSWNTDKASQAKRDELFREYRHTLRPAAGLEGRSEPWREYAPDLTFACLEDPHEVAAMRAEKDAEKLLFALTYGEGEK